MSTITGGGGGGKGTPQPVDLCMSVVIPLGATWMMNLYDYMKLNPDIIRNGFRHADIIIQ